MTVMFLNSIVASAKFEEYENSDGTTLGYYEGESNVSEREKTEKLYSDRPKNERRFEYLTRGLIAVPSETGNLVSWRFLGTDSESLAYNLYAGKVKLNVKPIITTNFFHTGASAETEYTLKEVVNGIENGIENGVEYSLVQSWPLQPDHIKNNCILIFFLLCKKGRRTHLTKQLLIRFLGVVFMALNKGFLEECITFS